MSKFTPAGRATGGDAATAGRRIRVDVGARAYDIRIDTGRGGVGLLWVRQSSTDRSLPGRGFLWWRSDAEPLYPFHGPWMGWARRIGFEQFSVAGAGPNSFQDLKRGLAFPCWLPAITFGVVPALWIRATRHRRRRERVGMCPQCGYDLRASRERCPECGTVMGR